MPRDASSPATGTQAEEVAAEIAGHVGSAIVAAVPGADPPVIQINTGAGLPVSGSVDIDITYKTTQFVLTGKLPGSDNQNAYIFKLTMKKDQGTAKEIATFTFVHKDH